jgi:O-antigen/teichoic acid export membrane protein
MRLVTSARANWQRASRPGFARSVGILTSGTLLAYSLGVVTVPIVSRLYDPQDFGEYALISSVAAVVTALISLGLQSAIVRAATDEESQRILTVGLAAAAALATLILAVGLALAPVVRLFATSLPYAMACLLVWFMCILASANTSLRAYANRRGANRVLFTNTLIGAGATLLVTLPLGLMGAGATGLIAGAVGALVVGNIQMAFRLRPFHRRPSLADVRGVFRENSDFVAFQYPANLVETVSEQAPRQILSLMFGATAVGLYAMTDKMLGIPLGLVGAPVGTVYFREASQRSAAGENLSSFTMRLVVTIMAVAYLPILLVVLWGEPLFGWLLGSAWAKAGAVASILVVQYLFLLTRTAVGTARVVLGLQSVNLIMSGVRLLVEVGALVGGCLLTRNVLGTLACFSAASTTFYVIDMTVTFRAMGRSHWRYLAGALAYCASVACFWLLGSAL